MGKGEENRRVRDAVRGNEALRKSTAWKRKQTVGDRALCQLQIAGLANSQGRE